MTKKFNLALTVDGQKFWSFNGTTKHAEERLVIAEVIKQVIRTIFKSDRKASFRESKELIPIENRIKKIKQVSEQEKE